MKTILLVTDLEADCSEAHRLLAECRGVQVQSCPSSEMALELMKLTAIDVVVAELHMNGLDGLALLQEVRSMDCNLPVILITDDGCEDSAMHAIRKGADGYIPRRHFAEHLVATVESVLEEREQENERQRALTHVTGRHVTLSLPNDRGPIRGVIVLLQEMATSLGVVQDHDAVRLGMAVEESISNAIIHGNLEVGSDLREHEDGRYDDLIRERAVMLPYCERRVQIMVHATPQTICIEVEDEGPGFNAKDLADPTDPENLLRASGRGLLLIQAFMDEVAFNERGNCITMIKRRKSTTFAQPFGICSEAAAT